MALEKFSTVGRKGEVGLGGSTSNGPNPNAATAMGQLSEVSTTTNSNLRVIKMTGRSKPNSQAAPVNFRGSGQNERMQFRYSNNSALRSVRFEITRETESVPVATFRVNRSGYQSLSAAETQATVGPGGIDPSTNDYVINVQLLQPGQYTVRVFSGVSSVLLAELTIKSRARGPYNVADRHLDPALGATNVNPAESFAKTRWHSNRRSGSRSFNGLGRGNVTITT